MRLGELRGAGRVIVLLEPVRPAGFQSGGYRYQAEVMAPRIADDEGVLRAVAPARLADEVAQLRRQWPGACFVVDGLFATTTVLPAGTIALLHTVPEVDLWSAAALPVITTAASTAASDRVRARASEIVVVPPGLDDCFCPRTTGGTRRPGVPRITCVGALGPGKGQSSLWSALASAPVPSELTLLGAGTREFAPPPGGSAVTLHRRGVLPPTGVAEVLHDSDLCVSWSRSESFGMAVAEAVACATPVLAFATGAIGSFVQSGVNGWLLPPDADDAAMTAALHALLLAPERLMRAHAAARPVRLPSWSQVAADFATACRRLAERTDRSAAPESGDRRPDAASPAASPGDERVDR